LDTIPIPTMIAEASGRVIAVNAAASRLLARDRGLRLADGRLQATETARAAELDRRLRQVASGEPDSASLIVEQALDDGFPLVLALGRLAASELPRPLAETVAPDTQLVAVFARNAAGLQTETLPRVFDLSPSESAIADALAAGETPQSVAASRAVSVSTVRAQIRQILAKTGLSRTHQLIGLYHQLW
jgi:DNA-binding NarL/FixJ family response regulator